MVGAVAGISDGDLMLVVLEDDSKPTPVGVEVRVGREPR